MPNKLTHVASIAHVFRLFDNERQCLNDCITKRNAECDEVIRDAVGDSDGDT